MLKDSDIEGFIKRVLKDSDVEISDPDFNNKAMEKVLRKARRRRLMKDILFYSLVFISVDAFIAAGFWLFGINIFTFSFTSISRDISQDLFLFVKTIGDSILNNGIIIYLFILALLIALADILSEPTYKFLERNK